MLDNQWNNPQNWCSGVPGETDEVEIPAGLPYYPLITGNAGLIHSLKVFAGAKLTLAPSAQITIGPGLCDFKGEVVLGENARLNLNE